MTPKISTIHPPMSDNTSPAVHIVHADFVAGYSSFYFDDQLAIKQGATLDGFVYRGAPVTEGFTRVRQAGECVSVLLTLSDGRVAVGDCAAVQYSGAGGRDPLLLAQRIVPWLRQHLAPRLEGLRALDFLANARLMDVLTVDGQRLHTAVRYGLSQALLDAAALASGRLATEVLCAAYQLPVITQAIALFGQTGDDRYAGADKMLLKRVDVLPHGLINHVAEKLGHQGEKLRDYLRWLTRRIRELAPDDYRPALHIDVYGTVGQAFDHDVDRIAAYLAALGDEADGLSLAIEGPVDAGSCPAQIEMLGRIRQRLRALGSPVLIVADEWCNTYEDVVAFADAACCDMVQIKTPDLGSVHNTLEAVLYARGKGVQAYQGGTCNETDVSARACVHVALAGRPMRLLVKPGMGFDEGMTIVHNEMQRALAVLRRRHPEAAA